MTFVRELRFALRTLRSAPLVSILAVACIGLGLVDTNPADPLILGAAAALLGGIALVAGWLPARRASRVSPVAALRTQ